MNARGLKGCLHSSTPVAVLSISDTLCFWSLLTKSINFFSAILWNRININLLWTLLRNKRNLMNAIDIIKIAWSSVCHHKWQLSPISFLKLAKLPINLSDSGLNFNYVYCFNNSERYTHLITAYILFIEWIKAKYLLKLILMRVNCHLFWTQWDVRYESRWERLVWDQYSDQHFDQIGRK